MSKKTLSQVGLELSLFAPSDNPKRNCTQYYHYTSARVKEKIVEGKMLKFRLSMMKDFLDANEGTMILEPYYHACGRLHEDGSIDDDFFLVARSITAQMLRKQNKNIWVLCLSPNGCSPFMKERYASKDGWIVSFQSSTLVDLCLDFPENWGFFQTVEMQYSFAQMRRLMEKNLKKLFKGYQNDLKAEIQGVKKNLKQQLLRLLYQHSLCYKGEAYRREQEVRLILHLKDGFSDWESEDQDLRLHQRREGKKDYLYLLIGEKYFYQATQTMSKYNDKHLNVPLITQAMLKKC